MPPAKSGKLNVTEPKELNDVMELLRGSTKTEAIHTSVRFLDTLAPYLKPKMANGIQIGLELTIIEDGKEVTLLFI